MESLITKRILLRRIHDILRFPEESAVVPDSGEFNTSLVHETTPGTRCEIGAGW